MDDPKTSPSTSEAVGEMPANTTPISHPIHEQSDNIRPVPIPQNGTDLPTKMDGPPPSPPPPPPPPYDKDNANKQATPVANNNPYPGYNPSHVRIAVTPLERLGEVPAHINCPFCNTISLTTVTKTDSSQTTVAAVLCCLCCGIITVCLPHWLGWYQNIEHRCGNCKRRVAYKPNDGAIHIETGAVTQYQMPGAPQPVHKAA